MPASQSSAVLPVRAPWLAERLKEAHELGGLLSWPLCTSFVSLCTSEARAVGSATLKLYDTALRGRLGLSVDMSILLRSVDSVQGASNGGLQTLL